MVIQASFDDASIQDMLIAGLMQQYKINTIFYWPVYPEQANAEKGRKSLNEDQMQYLAQRFEIGSHTINHPLLTRIPPELAWVEINDSRKILQEKFHQPINSFCYPRGYSNPEIQQMVVEAGYDNARSTLVGYVHQSENPYFIQTAVHVSADRKEYAGLSWFDYGIKLFNIAKKIPDSVFHIFGHGWEISQHNDWEKLEEFLGLITL